MGQIFSLEAVFDNIPLLLEYLPVTLKLAIFSFLIGIILGLIIAIIRIQKPPVLYQLTTLYVSIVRGTPVLVQLYISYYGFPMIVRYLNLRHGFDINIEAMSGVFYSILALGINQSAYSSETFRAGILSVDKGQIEASIALGMTRGESMRRIVFPIALVVALPGLGNSFITMIKSTSLAFLTGVIEMTAQGKILGGRTYRYFEVYISLAIIYWLLTVILEIALNFLEKKIAIPEESPRLVTEEVEND